MDVKTAFLNGNLDEDIFMQQPVGFIAVVKKTWYASCKSLFMGLSKHQEVGTSDLIKRSNLLDLFKIWMSLVFKRNMRRMW